VARDAGRTGRRPPGGTARPGKAASTGTGQGRAPAGARSTAAGKAAADAGGAALRSAVADRLAPALAEAGFDLEDLHLSRAGSRSVLRVVVDRDGGIDLDAVADASRLASDLLDRVGDEVGLAGTYVLEVTSPGVDRPLTQPRHWRRARGRLVEVRRADGTAVEGRVLGGDDDGVDLAVATGPVRRGRPVRTRIERVLFADVERAVVQIEFSHADGAAGGATPRGAAGSAGDEDATDADEGDGAENDGADGEGADGEALDADDHLDDSDLWDDEDDEDPDDEGVDGDDGNDGGGWDGAVSGLGERSPAGGGPATGNDLGGARRGRPGGGRGDGGPVPGEETDR